jgi:TBC1 domain family member 2B
MINKFRLPPNHKSSSKLSSLSSCCQCKALQNQIVNISDDLNATEKELQATREVIKVLREQLEITVNENDSLSAICKTDSSSADILQELQKRERDLTAAKIKLKQKDVNIEKLTNENQLIVNEKNKLSEQLAIMEELIQIKDATVISLTNEIFDLEKQKKAVEDSKMIKISSNELENLQDSLNAYRIQNQFLNKEIIELNELRNVSEKRQQEVQLKCCEWEAKYCQIQSKLLSLLKELNQSIELQSKSDSDQAQNQLISNNNSIKVLVSRLLEESSIDIPLSWKAGNRKLKDSNNLEGDYDVLGFVIKSNSLSDEIEDEVKNSAQEDTENEYSKYYRTWQSRWNTFIVQWNINEFQKSHDLKIILRSGVPQEYRCKIWRYLINLRIRRVKEKLGRDYYQKCCNEVTLECKLKPSIKQIELDLLRTLPNNKHFENIDSIGVTRLRRVLTCYSVHNPSVGYCQGMNRLAAVALLFMPEEDAFWCLMTIVENIMPPDYFTPTLLGAHVDQYVLKDLLAEKLPNLLAHLEKHDIELSLFSWFLTCFVDNIPSRIYLRIWDVFLYEGNKVLFRFALAFLKYHAESILELNDSVAINHFLRTIGDKTKDVRKLSHIAFSLLNPFPMSTVKRKRSHYTEVVLNELGKLESIRKASPIHQPNYDSASD